MERIKRDIKSLTLEELNNEITAMGIPSFRAKQIYQWLHQKMAESFNEMTNLSKELREKLEEQYRIPCAKQVNLLVSAADGTKKYLFALEDGRIIESVWMKYRHGNSVCISSQVGCRMGCRFCASTLDGLERNLLPSEMLDQVYQIQKETNERVSHVVVMGSGEPMDNLDHLIRFIRLISSQEGLHISRRNLTVSTCGIVPGIRRLADENLSVTLALSLHAPNDSLRQTLMPIARRYPLKDVLAACRDYFLKTGRRITFEYSLVKGINDSRHEARELAWLLSGQEAHVNLIPVNPIEERAFVPSEKDSVLTFKHVLEKSKIAVTVRREMGRDIQGACGQLRKGYKKSMDSGADF